MAKVLWAVILLLNIFNCHALVMDVKMDLQHPVSTIGPRYIGVTIDTSNFMGGFTKIDINSAKLHSITRALSPSYVRVGGTKADTLIFDPSQHGQHGSTVGTDLMKKLWDLVQIARWDLIFDVNLLVRKGGHWDPSNARELLKFFSQQGVNVSCFQLGNEPTAFPRKYNTTVSPQTLARDYQNFKAFLHEFPRYRNSCVLGPEVGRILPHNNEEYLIQFLQAGGNKALSAVGVHHYYCAGNPHITLGFYTNVDVMESLRGEVQNAMSVSRQYAPHLPVWQAESGTTYNGCNGETGLRLTYANGFLWLDKLGMAALYGIQHINRQDFFHNILDGHFNPFPDYFLTVLYKRLVQGPVFKVMTSTKTVRLYAHCANPQTYSRGALTVYIINVESIDIELTLSQFSGQQLNLYLLTPGDGTGDLSSRTVALNGKQLVMSGNELPPMPPRTVHGSFSIPAKTFGFVVIPHADVDACKA